MGLFWNSMFTPAWDDARAGAQARRARLLQWGNKAWSFPQAAASASTVVVGALTQAQISAAAGDRPMVLASHAIYAARTAAAFRLGWSTTGSFANPLTADDPQSPAYSVFDFQFNRFAKPSALATTWYFLLDFGASVQAFDAALILGHNFGTIGGLTITLQVADDAAFATNLRTLATWTPGASNKRLVNLTLGGGNNAYSSVEYARLVITTAGAAFAPQIGEIVLSSRRQMNMGALLPYNQDAEESDVVDFTARSGVRTRYVRNKGQKVLGGTIFTANAADAAPVLGWWTDCALGSLPFAWIEHPNSAPSTAIWAFWDARSSSSGKTSGGGIGLDFPYVSDVARKLVYALTEQGAPFFENEV